MELKFANSQDIYSFTYNAIRETLLFKELIPDVAPGKDSKPETYKQRNVGDAPEAFENKRREALVGPAAQAKGSPDTYGDRQSPGEVGERTCTRSATDETGECVNFREPSKTRGDIYSATAAVKAREYTCSGKTYYRCHR